MKVRGAQRATRLAAAVLVVAALLPALHHAASHQASGGQNGPAFAEAAADSAAPTTDACPICLAGKIGTALPTARGRQGGVASVPIQRPHGAPHAGARVARGPAAPRAPPSA